jgi:protein-disulfide isomerase
MNRRLEVLFTGMLVAAAVVVAAALAHREFAGPKQSTSPKLEFVSAWPGLLAVGRRMGDSTAPVKIVEFADLQCPFCKRFNETLRNTLKKYGARVEVVFVHDPLPMHRLALSAARAAECANSQGRFSEFVDQVYEMQESLAELEPGGQRELGTWTAVAAKAGVKDTNKFRRCAADTAVPAMIDAGVKAAKQFGVMGTPTVIVNGWRFSIPPREADLHRRIDRLLAGKSPVTFLSRLF